MIEMSPLYFEVIFWLLFIAVNSMNYVLNYLLHFRNTFLIPYLYELKAGKQFTILTSSNLDPFRFYFEISALLICSRFVDLSTVYIPVTVVFVFVFSFNLYQYSIRHIYFSKPILYSDLTLLKNGFVIVWSESKAKVIIAIGIILLTLYGFSQGIRILLTVNATYPPSLVFYFLAGGFLMMYLYFFRKQPSLHLEYPNDVYLRYHVSFAEFIVNLKSSLELYQVISAQHGKKYYESRQGIQMEPKEKLPNLYFFFIESYGAFYFNSLPAHHDAFNQFSRELEEEGGYAISSNFSASTTTGGQSWLTYSSALYGYRMTNNTLFESYLRDPDFLNSKHLLKLLKELGYTNYNLNPINPINGINVPYDEIRQFYAIDHWILNKDINYQGNLYGFGACPPDQYSLTFTMEKIKAENTSPHTLFFLTKNSHSPFIVPDFVDDWQSLNKGNISKHINPGFLSSPSIDNYTLAIQYEYDVLKHTLLNYGSGDDIFIIMGDHQPPVLSDTEKHGTLTPVHIISKNTDFVRGFDTYGFKEKISEIQDTIRHEGLYSIFLNVFANQYARHHENVPTYEPEGVLL